MITPETRLSTHVMQASSNSVFKTACTGRIVSFLLGCLLIIIVLYLIGNNAIQ